MIEAAQIKAARALLGLGQVELSELAGVGLTTLKRIELSDEITGSARTLWKIQTALEAAGVEFIPADDEKGPGLRLKHKVRGKRVKRSQAQSPKVSRRHA
jgi:transcriptional regulator with XRE-family HTH domain